MKRRATAGPLEGANRTKGDRPTITHQLQTTALDEIGELLAEQGFDGLADALRVLLNEVMKLGRASVLKAGPYERAEGRTGYANGFKPKTVQTRVGALTLAVPQARGVEFYPSALEKGLRSERALKLAVAEMSSSASRLARSPPSPRNSAGWRSPPPRSAGPPKPWTPSWRSGGAGPWARPPYLILDARYEKVPHGGQVRSCAVLVAIVIDPEGRRSVLGVSVSLSEAEVHWRDFLASLAARGRTGSSSSPRTPTAGSGRPSTPG